MLRLKKYSKRYKNKKIKKLWDEILSNNETDSEQNTLVENDQSCASLQDKELISDVHHSTDIFVDRGIVVPQGDFDLFGHEPQIMLENLNVIADAALQNSKKSIVESPQKLAICAFQKFKMMNDYVTMIRDWVTNNKCLTQIAVTQLLVGIKNCFGAISDNFPVDYRTIMKNDRNAAPSDNITNLAGGQYCHFGLKEGIIFQLRHGFETHHKAFTVKEGKRYFVISLFIDGFKMFNSTTKNFWCILGSVLGAKDYVPFCVGLYYSEIHHPNSFIEFLEKLMQDLAELKNEVFVVENKQFSFSYDGPIICDLPAKTDVKGIIPHGGFFSCDKCVARGSHNTKLHFPFTEEFDGKLAYTVLRTDTSFRNKIHHKHHRKNSAFESIPEINMVDNFVTEYMHGMCIGVMKKLMRSWLVLKSTARLNLGKRKAIEAASLLLKTDCPEEFKNKPQGYEKLSYFKAKDYRAVLGYWGIVIFKNYLPEKMYTHFLRFSCAFRYLASDLAWDPEIVDYAEKLLIKFVKHFGDYYEEKNIVRNVHGLLHVASDCRRYGNLDRFSAFKFESYLYPLKRLIHGPNKPLEQVHNQLMKYRKQGKNIVNYRPAPSLKYCMEIKKTKNDELNSKVREYKKVILPHFSIRTKHPNNTVILNDETIFVIEKIIQIGNADGYIKGRKFAKIDNLFLKPMPSKSMDIYSVSSLKSTLEMRNITDIANKCIRTKIDENGRKFAIIPLIHSLH